MTTKKQKTERKKRKLEHWQVIALYLMIYDVIAVNAAYFLDCGSALIVHTPQYPENICLPI